MERYSLGMCLSWVHCTHSVSLLWNGSYITADNKEAAWKVARTRVQHLSTKKCKFRWFPVAPTYSHFGTISLLKTYSYGIRILSDIWSMEPDLFWCSLYCQPISWAQLLELWYGGEEYLIESHRPPWFGFSQADRSVHWAFLVGGRVTKHTVNQSRSH